MAERSYDLTDLRLNIALKSGLPKEAGRNPCAHYHNTHELCFFVHSSVRAFMQDSWHDVRDGEIVFVPHYQMHRYDYQEGGRYTRLLINVGEHFLRETLSMTKCSSIMDGKLFAKCIHIHPTPAQFKRVFSMAEEALFAFEEWHDQPDEERLALVRARMFCLLYELRPLLSDGVRETLPADIHPCVQLTIKQIDTFYAEQLTLDEMARQVHIDKYHLCHLFVRHTGISIMKYLQYRRVIEAERLLMNTDLPLDVVACRSGFGTMQHFHRVFKEILGTSPGKYRKGNQQ